MKQKQFNKAYPVLMILNNTSLPLKKSYMIYMLIKKIEPIYQFSIKKEKELLEKYKGTLSEDGLISFKSPEDIQGFKNEIAELEELDIDVEIDTIKLSENDISNLSITPNDISNLENFIEFNFD